jgi:hypothetical protein
MNDGTLDLSVLEQQLVAEHAALTKRLADTREALSQWEGKKQLFLQLRKAAEPAIAAEQPASAEAPAANKESTNE